MEHWKTQNITDTFVEGVRGAIPLANEQIDMIHRIIRYFKPEFNSFLDLGCGDGVLGKHLFTLQPRAEGIFADYSEPMIKSAKRNVADYMEQSSFYELDFEDKSWVDFFPSSTQVDIVISGFAIHHQNNQTKKRIYKQIHDRLLNKGGIFLNLDQVASPSKDFEKLFDKYFLESMKSSLSNHSDIKIEDIQIGYYADKKMNKLAPVGEQLNWLREVGFSQVDCYFKNLELSLFGGIKK